MSSVVDLVVGIVCIVAGFVAGCVVGLFLRARREPW